MGPYACRCLKPNIVEPLLRVHSYMFCPLTKYYVSFLSIVRTFEAFSSLLLDLILFCHYKVIKDSAEMTAFIDDFPKFLGV